VIIEDDVMIAAGTTVSSATVAKGSLAISRTKLRIVQDFYYKFFNKNNTKI
jgi:bifunctional UDP-N-acetylglucosamine pyrophosphorylase/glucosamine-1-phosphate N-acetyltransferase